MALDVRMGDVVEMRKPHPCGSRVWTVVRVGADIGLTCNQCERRILMDRPTYHRRVKDLVKRGEAVAPEIEAALFGSDTSESEQDASSSDVH
jgi:hypothetical protein